MAPRPGSPDGQDRPRGETLRHADRVMTSMAVAVPAEHSRRSLPLFLVGVAIADDTLSTPARFERPRRARRDVSHSPISTSRRSRVRTTPRTWHTGSRSSGRTKCAIFSAAAHAQRAVDFLRGLSAREDASDTARAVGFLHGLPSRQGATLDAESTQTHG